MNKIEYKNERIYNLNRYCDGLRRAEYLALQLAKEAFAKGKDDTAKELRFLAHEIAASISNAEAAHLKDVNYWEEPVRAPKQSSKRR